MLWTPVTAVLREALVLVGAQELTHEEAAQICGVPVGTMKARVSRARSELTRVLPRGRAALLWTFGNVIGAHPSGRFWRDNGKHARLPPTHRFS